MATSVAVVMAWNDPSDADRQVAFRYVAGLYSRMALGPITVGSCEPFARARALNGLIGNLPADTIIVQSDPDSFLPREATYREAIRLADSSPGLVVPFSRYRYLNQATTGKVLGWEWNNSSDGAIRRFDCDEDGDGGVGNVTVFSKETWVLAGGYDERFPLWGGDDGAFAVACNAMAGPTKRLPGSMIHLWHPRLPESDPSHPDYPTQFEIVAAYRDADLIGPAAVRHLVESR